MAEDLKPTGNSSSRSVEEASIGPDALKVPPRGDVIDRLQRHRSLQQFGKHVDDAAKSIYPNQNRSRYLNVYVLMFKWENEDPKLPVSYEIEELRKVFEQIYHFKVEVFDIPDNRSHANVSEKINAFVAINNDSKLDLKIVYYAGHSRLSKTKDLVWSSWQTKNERYPTVSWTGIQRALEQAESDALVLLDCCSSGIGVVGEGNGVTEIISACAFDVIANGVGHYSFTKALTTELRLLSKKISFPVSELYTHIYCRAQHHLAQGIANERYPAPIHLQLTRDDQFERGLYLSIQDLPGGHDWSPVLELSSLGNSKKSQTHTSPIGLQSAVCSTSMGSDDISHTCTTANMLASCSITAVSSDHPTFPESETVETSPLEDSPRMLLAIRLTEDTKADGLSIELFREWLRTIPAAVEEVKVEAGFTCDSSLRLTWVPLEFWQYVRQNPAKFPFGLVIPSDFLTSREPNSTEPESNVCSVAAAKRKGKEVKFTENTSEQIHEAKGKRGGSQFILPGPCVTEKTFNEQNPRESVTSNLSILRDEFSPGLHFLKPPKSQSKKTSQSSNNFFVQRFPLNALAKSWREQFFDHHKFRDEWYFSRPEDERDFWRVYDELVVSQDSGNSRKWRDWKVVERYFGGLRLEDLEARIGEWGNKKAAWIDDRNSPYLFGRGNVRQVGAWFTAAQMLRHLKQSRYSHADAPNAERRLIYVENLSPEYILALTATASYILLPVLRDVICQHVAFRPSIRVYIPSDEFLSFRLEFHLPFFALRKLPSESSSPSCEENSVRDWEELALLTRDQDENQELTTESYRLHEAQVSCVVHGCDEWQWTTYAFEDTQHDLETEGDGKDYGKDGHGGESESDGSALIVFEHDEYKDPITCLLDNRFPIWRPREYFLKALETQMRKVLAEWDALTVQLEADSYAYRRQDPFNPSASLRYTQFPVRKLEQIFHWIRLRIDLFTKLLGAVSATIRAWDKFILPDGDIGYFSDLDCAPDTATSREDYPMQLVRSIIESFEILEDIQGRLLLLKELLDGDLSTVQIVLSFKSHETGENNLSPN